MAADAKGLTFLQISDSHMGFDKPANPNAKGTLEEAIGRIKAIPQKPAFMIHTGDITHLSKEIRIRRRRKDHRAGRASTCITCRASTTSSIPTSSSTRNATAAAPRARAITSFDANGVHFIGLVNVANLKGGGMGSLGDEQLEWIEDDLKGRSASTPIVVFAHIPLWTVYPQWGWGTEDGARALGYLKRFGSVTVLNGHIHQVMQKVEGNVTFHTARSTAFPQPAPGTRAVARADESAGRTTAQHARHRQRHLQAGRAAARHHRHPAARAETRHERSQELSRSARWLGSLLRSSPCDQSACRDTR